MKVTVCNCNPAAHAAGGIVSTDTRLIRRMRKDYLDMATRWEARGCTDQAVICARYIAHLCLLRLRELKQGLAA